MMEEGYTSLPSSLLGSVPAVITEVKKPAENEGATPNANLKIFPPTNGGYQPPGSPHGKRYDPIWICTTLVFMLSALGNCATYPRNNRGEPDAAWNFDVNYANWAACVIYGYTLVVPAALFFLLQYLGANTSPIRLWCMWGYSLFIFIPNAGRQTTKDFLLNIGLPWY